MGVPEAVGAARPGLFTALSAAAEATPGETGLYVACLVGACALVALVSLALPAVFYPLPDDPLRRNVSRIATVVVPVSFAAFAAAALLLPPIQSGRQARIAAICGDILSDVRDGRVAEITTWVQRTVERECGTERLIAAANAPTADLRLH